jgi:hypothetical protein
VSARPGAPGPRAAGGRAGPGAGIGSALAVRRVFLSLLGSVFAIAFGSLWVQLPGLFGSEGILPACAFLDLARERLGAGALLGAPTLFWIRCSDAALHAACAAGLLFSLLLAVGVAPSLCAALVWLLYLSLSNVGDPFLGYQWDALLLEAAFLAIFLAPRQLRPRDAWRTPVPGAVLWLLRWLVFRVFFLSGAVKLGSGDETWRTLSALDYHYFTQPLPAWTSWYAHHLPHPVHALSVLAMFAIELAAPFAALGPRRLRAAACAAFLLLQGLIALTGNYGFFNLLCAALCVTLLDDAVLWKALPRRWRECVERAPDPAPGRRRLAARVAPLAWGALVVAVAVLTGASAWLRLGWGGPPAAVGELVRRAAPLRTFNAYGLFAVMTTERPEILLEGSADGRHWQAYAFRWKPGPPERAPGFAQPHMPRLDWQMWFAALRGGCPAWFQSFMLRLLEGSAPVRALLARAPFGDAPPRYLRSTLYRYRFAPPGSGDWWQREALGAYCPTATLRGGRLERASPGP